MVNVQKSLHINKMNIIAICVVYHVPMLRVQLFLNNLSLLFRTFSELDGK